MIQQIEQWTMIEGTYLTTKSAQVTREIAATTPAALGSPGGIMAATASATLVEGSDTTVIKDSPWDRKGGWPPSEGEEIFIRANTKGDNTYTTRFEGIIEDVDGSAADPNIEVSAVDPLDRLVRDFEFQPTASPMPLLRGSITPRMVDPLIRHEWFVDRILRSAGWHFNYLPGSSADMFLPLQGGLLESSPTPNRLYETPSSPGAYHPTNRGLGWSPPADWVEWVCPYKIDDSDLVVSVSHREGGPATQGVEIQGTGGSVALVNRGRVRIETSPTRVRVIINLSGSQTSTHDVETSWPARITVRRQVGSTILFVNGSIVDTLSNTNPNHTQPRIAIRGYIPSGVTANSSPISHVILARAGRGLLSGSTTPTAVMHPGKVLVDPYKATRYLRGNGRDILAEIARATSSAAWIDRQGRFHWAHPDAFDDAEPELEINSDADLINLAWSNSVRDVYQSVRIQSSEPTPTISNRADVKWWQGAGDTIPVTPEMRAAGQFWIREIASPPSDTDWLDAKTGPYVMERTTSSKDLFALGQGDWYGVTVYHESYGDPLDAYEGFTGYDTRKISSQAFEMGTNAMLDPASGASYISPRIPDKHFQEATHPQMMPYNNTPLPILRGFGKIEWAAGAIVSAGDGPERAADYTHDVSWWVQGADRQRLANWMADQTSKSRALLKKIPIIPRMDLQLGMVVTVREDQVYDCEIRTLIIGMDETYESGRATMHLTLRVLSVY